jgi:ferrous iron transport protein A
MEQARPKPLSAVEAGQTVRLVGIEAGHGLRSRLTAMGLVPNVEITVVNNRHAGPFIMSVKGTRMMIGRGMAHKIMVV